MKPLRAPMTSVPMNDRAAPVAPRFDAVLIGNDVSRAEAAVAAAGGRVGRRVEWRGELDVAGSAVLVIEAEGMDEAALEQVLPDVARFAADRGLKVVAAADIQAIDLVAAWLWGPGVELLVRPSLPDRIDALLRVGAPATLSGDAFREEEVPAFGVEPPAGPPPDAAELRRAIRTRRMREAFFMPGLFADPAWDMLLDLYAAELEGEPVSVSSLCIAAAVAPTTALRWIARMTEDGLLERRPDESDRRRAFMALTDVARVGMRGYLEAVRRAGLGIA